MRYGTDLSDKEWAVLRPFFEGGEGAGRPCTYSVREMLNACFYVMKTGCQWRYLPKDFPKWTAVYKRFQRWNHDGTWQIALRNLHRIARKLEGREETPSAAIIDSQSVKSKRGASTRAKK